MIDIEKYEKNEYSENEINQIINNLKIQEISPGLIIHVKKGCIHRVEALEDVTMLEASTTELDDVIRLQDDSNRPSGKITQEHLD